MRVYIYHQLQNVTEGRLVLLIFISLVKLKINKLFSFCFRTS